MGISRRIRRILKGYVKTARERLDELEAELNARRELEDYLEPGGGSGVNLPPEVSTARPTLPPVEQGSTSSGAVPLSPDLQAHFRLLGIPSNADLRQAQEAYKQLMERAKPERFPEGSEERRRAEQICQRIQQAYDAVRQYLDPTSARFDRLEI
ncbi:MAG: hypothetical protein KatS3mg023_0994 [Armatimonadota bacterium]|nr:MAG: hypothetical protein KatS3mg023_0994 [Armatimonadota bacterium]